MSNKYQSVADAAQAKRLLLNSLSTTTNQDLTSTGYNTNFQPVDALQAALQRQRERQLAEQQQLEQALNVYDERQERAWTTDDETGSIWGATKQLANRALQGGAEFAGRVAAYSDNREANRLLGLLDDSTRNALAKKRKGETLTPEEQALLEQDVVVETDTRGDEYSGGIFSRTMKPTEIEAKAMEHLKGANDKQAYFTEDTWITRGFNETDRQAMTQDLDAVWEESGKALENADGFMETAEAITGLLAGGLKAIGDNPMAAAEYFAESAVDFVTASNPVTGAIQAESYAKDIMVDNLRKYYKENGRFPTVEKQRELALEAYGAAALDFASNAAVAATSGLSRLGGVASRSGKATEKAAEQTGSLAKEVSKTGAKTVGSTASEAVTEGIQTAIENDAFGQDFNFAEDAREIYQAGVIGAAASGVPNAVGATSEVSGSVNRAAQRQAEEARKASDNRRKGAAERVDAAMATGDFDSLVSGNTSENSNDSVQNSTKVGVKENLSNIAARHADLARQESVDVKEADKVASTFYNTYFAAVDRFDEVNEQLKTAKGKEKANLQAEANELKDAINYAEQNIATIKTNQEAIRKTRQSVEVVTDENVSTEEFQQVHAQRIIDSVTVNPDAVSVEEMDTLVKSDKWAPEQRAYLQKVQRAHRIRKEVSNVYAARSESKNTSQVFDDVINGKGDRRGITSYRDEIVNLVKAGNTLKARQVRNALATFTRNHSEKARMFTEAFRPYAERGRNAKLTAQEQQIIQEVENTFKRLDGKGFKIGWFSGDIVDNTNLEAAALRETLAEMDALLGNPETVINPFTDNTVTTNDTNVEESVTAEDTAAPVNTDETVSTTEQPTTTQEIDEDLPPWEVDDAPASTSTTTEVNTENADPAVEPTVTEATETAPEATESTQETTEGDIPPWVTETVPDDAESDIPPFETDDVVNEPTTEADDVDLDPEPAPVEEDIEPVPSTFGENLVSRMENTRFGKWFKTRATRGVIADTENSAELLRNSPERLLNQEELTPKERAAVSLFNDFQERFSQIMGELHSYRPNINPRYRLENSLVNENGELDPKVVEVMGTVAHNYVAFSAKGDEFSPSKDRIAKMLGIREHQVSNRLYRLLSDKGVNMRLLAKSLGGQVTGALGITIDKKTTNDDMLGELQTTLGNHILAGLIDAGLLETQTYSNKFLIDRVNQDNEGNKDIRRNSDLSNPNSTMTFVRMAGNDGSRIGITANQIVNANQGTKRLLASLLEDGSEPVAPSLERDRDVVRRQKNTVRRVSEAVRKILKKAQDVPWTLAKDTDAALSLFSDEEQNALIGVVSEDELANMPPMMRDTTRAKNESLIREKENLNEWRDILQGESTGLDTPFFFDYTQWKTQRIGIENTLINPQASKVHRGVMTPKAWRKVIQMNNAGDVQLFKLGVAQSLGIDIDKLSTEEAIKQLDQLIADNPEVAQAAKGIVRLLRNQEEPDAAEIKAAVMKVVRMGGEGTHSLHGLVNLGRFLAAQEQGRDNFISDQWTEIDGVTNGPIIGLLQFGNGSLQYMKEMLRKGGLFFDWGRSLGVDKVNGEKDLYETLAQYWTQAVEKAKQELRKTDLKEYQKMEAISRILGPITRKLAKNPLMTNIYGAGKRALKNALTDAFFEQVEDHIFNIINDNDKFPSDAAKVKALKVLTNYLNTLAGTDMKNPVYKIGTNPRAILRQEIDHKHVMAIAKAVEGTYGEHLFDAVERMFSAFMQNRTKFNDAIQSLNNVFLELLTQRLNQREAEMKRNGELEKDELLPQAEIDRVIDSLQAVIPGVSSMFSDNAKEQLQITRLRNVKVEGNRTIRSEFDRPVRGLNTNGFKKGDAKSISTGMTTRAFIEEIGVGGAIINIHSLDATVALAMLNNFPVLNVHDGFPVSSTDAGKAGRYLNQTFFNIMRDYDVYGEMERYLDKALRSVRANLEGENPVKLSDKLIKSLEKAKNQMGRMSQQHGKIKDQLFKDLEYVSQYNFEDFGFETEVGKERAKEREIEEQNRSIFDDRTVADVALGWEKAGKYATGRIKSIRDAGLDLEQSIHGALRDPNEPVTDPFAIVLEGYARTTDNVREIVIGVLDAFKGSNDPRISILRQVVTKIPDDLTLKIVRANDPYDRKKTNIVKGALGVYFPEDNQIVLPGTEYVYAGTTLETFTHELVHGMTAHLVEHYQAGGKVSANAKRAIDNLESLRQELIRKQEEGTLGYTDKYPLSNIHELMTYSLTNPEFQETLKNTRVRARGSNKMVNAFRALLDALADFFFDKQDLDMRNALYQAMTLSTAVMEEFAKDKIRPNTPKPQLAPLAHRVPDMTAGEILNVLIGNDNSPRSQELRDIQENLINTVVGNDGVRILNEEAQLGDIVDSYLEHLANGTKPIISNLRDVFPFNKAELFVAEQLEAVFDSPLSKSTFPRNELYRVWQQAKDAIKPEDLARNPNDAVELRLAQARWDYLFNPKKNKIDVSFSEVANKVVDNSTSDFLQRFVIAASLYQPLRDKLGTIESPAVITADPNSSLLKRVQTGLQQFMQRVSELLNGNVRVSGDLLRQHDSLIRRLATISRDNKSQLIAASETMSNGEAAVDRFVRESVNKVGNRVSRSLRESENAFIGAIGDLIDVHVNDRADEVIKLLKDFGTRREQERQGAIGEAITEVMGKKANNSRLVNLLRFGQRDNEQARRFVREGMKDVILKAFSKPLNEFKQTNLTKAFIKTDTAALLDSGYSMNDIQTFLTDPVALSREIKRVEDELSDFRYRDYYINQSNALGYYMATGHAGNNMQMKNAHNIAYLYGWDKPLYKKEAARAEPIIDKLASLQAIKHTDQAVKADAAQTLLDEMSRTDNQNGVFYVLKQYSALKRESQERIFENDPSLMTKGFVSEITNPHITMAFAEPGSPEAQDLEAQGYRLQYTVPRDKSLDNKPEVAMYTIEDGGMLRRVTGVMSLTSKVMKGITINNTRFQLAEAHGITMPDAIPVNDMVNTARTENEKLFNMRIEPNTGSVHAIPVVNPNGDIVEYRYEMGEAERENVLEKNYQIGDVLGAMGGNIVDKVSTGNINTQTIDVLYDQFRNDPRQELTHYIEVGPEAKDPEIRELWDLLPAETKQYAREVFGGERIMIEQELLTLVFGYRKASVTDLWTKDPETLSLSQKFFKQVFEYTLGKKYGQKLANRLRMYEDGWQEIIRAVKDIFVVKNLFTTLGNITSNTMLLYMSGLPLHDVFRLQFEGWNNAMRYNRMKKDVFDLQRSLEALNPNSAQYRKNLAKINELESEMATNPVHELMEAGLFQTIVEDIDSSLDPFSYKSKLMKKFDNFTESRGLDKFNALGRKLFITQDTALYKLLNQPIQLSDFAGRYAKYQYLTRPGNNQMSREQALDVVIEDFINYDIPTGKALQYMNDMGLVMFTKYFLRVQKPIFRLFRERPATTLLKMMTMNMLDISNPMDSSIFNVNPLDRLTNPFGTVLGAPDEILTINGILHLFGIK